jgi:hypothetical protein
MSRYEGPACPRCNARLTRDWIRTGTVLCPDCNVTFESVAFEPPAPRLQVADVATVGPDGASACANHARNAAVTSCTRCGLFICALCDLDVGGGSICPACFDRARSEGALTGAASRVRDYMAMGRVAVIVGVLTTFLFIGWLFGILAIYYAEKGRRELVKRREPLPRLAYGLINIFGGLEIIFGIIVAGAMIASFFMLLK